jgi:LysM repeat protein
MTILRLFLTTLFVLTLAPQSPAPEARHAVAPPFEAALGAAVRDTGEATTYVVQRGDSLARIAARFDVTIDELVEANQLTSTIIQPGQMLIVPGAPAPGPSSVYSRIHGNPAFIRRVKAALDWLQANDADAYARVAGYVTIITPSVFAHLAQARPLPDGCEVRALARPGMTVEMTAALIYHEASHCYQFATVGVLSTKEAEVYAYTEQIAFMERHGFSEASLDYYRRVLAYYQSQPDDGQYVPPPAF